TLLRHADRVGVACQAQLANVIGPIRTRDGGPAWRQSTFHPFALTSRYARGTVLRTEPTGPTYETTKYGEVPVLDTVAVLDEESGGLAVFAVNRSDEDLLLNLDLRGLAGLAPVGHLTLDAGTDPAAVNTAEQPDRVAPRELPHPELDGGRCAVRLPAISWNLLRFTPRL
ncbi:MAG TPA: alpha-L-arabinofuranosidase C-terminal domain-containing protein, partial [Micromonospora sp.]